MMARTYLRMVPVSRIELLSFPYERNVLPLYDTGIKLVPQVRLELTYTFLGEKRLSFRLLEYIVTVYLHYNTKMVIMQPDVINLFLHTKLTRFTVQNLVYIRYLRIENGDDDRD